MGTGNLRRATLRDRKDFGRLFDDGRYQKYGGFTLLTHRAEGPSLAAVCVGRRSGNAVVRNRLKRITREALNPWMNDLLPGWRIAILPFPRWAKWESQERSEALRNALQKSGALKTEPP
ncbi:MAG: ribonuclease P protein component [Leptospirales bacterium]|nr:ribonuclease P protein component [Leptospirales bacterium]